MSTIAQVDTYLQQVKQQQTLSQQHDDILNKLKTLEEQYTQWQNKAEQAQLTTEDFALLSRLLADLDTENEVDLQNLSAHVSELYRKVGRDYDVVSKLAEQTDTFAQVLRSLQNHYAFHNTLDAIQDDQSVIADIEDNHSELITRWQTLQHLTQLLTDAEVQEKLFNTVLDTIANKGQVHPQVLIDEIANNPDGFIIDLIRLKRDERSTLDALNRDKNTLLDNVEKQQTDVDAIEQQWDELNQQFQELSQTLRDYELRADWSDKLSRVSQNSSAMTSRDATQLDAIINDATQLQALKSELETEYQKLDRLYQLIEGEQRQRQHRR